jgi:hypothetical protein
VCHRIAPAFNQNTIQQTSLILLLLLPNINILSHHLDIPQPRHARPQAQDQAIPSRRGTSGFRPIPPTQAEATAPPHVVYRPFLAHRVVHGASMSRWYQQQVRRDVSLTRAGHSGRAAECPHGRVVGTQDRPRRGAFWTIALERGRAESAPGRLSGWCW